MKRRTFLGVASAAVASITNVCFARGGDRKPDVLVFTLKPQLRYKTIEYLRSAFRVVGESTGCMIFLLDSAAAECDVVGSRTFYSAKNGFRLKVYSRETGERIELAIKWCETETGLLAYWPLKARGPMLEGETLLMQVPGGLIVEPIS